MQMIYVVNKHNKPLMPTNRHSHIRKLIKQGKAVVINSNPFIVKLKYETADVTQPLCCGIDTAHKNNIVSGFHPGDVVKYEKHNKLKGNVKQDVFPVVSVDAPKSALYYTTTKNRRMKYCQRIKSGTIQFI